MKALLIFFACLLILASCQPGPPANTTSSPSPQTTPSPSALATPAPEPTPGLTEGNLIPNPGAEVGEQGQPVSWHPDTYGGFHPEFSWRDDTPYSGKYYLSTHVSDYGGEGDAKWVFDPQPLQGGQWYEYRDLQRSDGRSRMLYSCQPTNGPRTFYNAWQSEVSSGWQEVSFRFYLPSACSVSVIHSLDRNGFLDTDHHQMRQVAAKPFKQALASITFDDIWKTAYTIGAAELDKRGLKGSYYITQLFTETPTDLYASVADVQDLVKRGHEIGSHAHRHTNLSKLDSPGIIDDIRREVAFLKTFGANSPGIAYPFGDFDAKVENEVTRFHSYARTSLAGLNDGTAKRYKLRIIPVTIDSTTEELLTWLEAARKTNTWVIFLFHDLGDPLPGHIYRTSLDQYIKVLDAIKASNIKVVTVEQGLRETGL